MPARLLRARRNLQRFMILKEVGKHADVDRSELIQMLGEPFRRMKYAAAFALGFALAGSLTYGGTLACQKVFSENGASTRNGGYLSCDTCVGLTIGLVGGLFACSRLESSRRRRYRMLIYEAEDNGYVSPFSDPRLNLDPGVLEDPDLDPFTGELYESRKYQRD